jgi:HAD superfamily hydrolase (TIGR01509 family)
VIKAVFFDWFNTLAHYDPPREALVQQALQELGYSIPLKAVSQGLYLADKQYYEEGPRVSHGERAQEERARLYMRTQQTLLRAIEITPTDDLTARLVMRTRELMSRMRFVLYDDVLPALKVVRELGLTTGLLTNLQREVDSACRQLGISQYLDFAVTSLEVGADKPQPPIFLRALELARAKPEEAVHVGDQYRNDVLGARGVGIKGLLIDRSDLNADVTDCPRLRSLTEITRHLE